ncbi:hypothetical protein EDD36DRAFT_196740 [Exophiala viscosa]|uniref:MaoC-like domain-containing protein n=1 Tax=Exophiala viscosa TaxID=2486360 RepID=A0AAN6E2B3_9EURO|nr:hypothetical protein EDD36DRAFT_196740 [Exophiala viscosa]
MRHSLGHFKPFHRQFWRRWARYSSSKSQSRFATPFDFLKGLSLKPPQGTWDTHNIDGFYQVLSNHLALAPQKGAVHPGFQQVSFTEFLRESDLCADGGDRRYAPGDEWKLRVWAGGFMVFNEAFIHPSRSPLIYTLERVRSVRVVGNPADKDSKVFVTLTKTYHEAENIPGSTNLRPKRGRKPIIKEDKHLCFLRNIPSSLRSLDTLRRIQPPCDPFDAQTMKPTAALLFRFSALTSNDHRIHVNPDFTRQEYGIPNLLVHGPLTAVLMLEVLRKGHGLYTELKPYRLAVTEFSYKNLLPIFVNETITIACKPSEPQYKPSMGATLDRWNVWIQKGEGENVTVVAQGQATLARQEKPPGTVDETEPDWDVGEESLDEEYHRLTQY